MRAGRLLLLSVLAATGLSAAGCSDKAAAPTAQGYVEGEFVRIGPDASGRLATLDVAKGQWIEAGAPLFALDDRDETAAVTQAEARKAAAEAELADLKTGKRPEEIRVLDAQLAEATASLTEAQKSYDRNQQLTTRAVSSAAALDQATANLDAARARVDAAHQNRAVAELPARDDTIRAAEKNVAALAAALDDARTRLARRKQASPVAGRVDDTYFRVGEIVPAGKPVVSLLPPAGRKIVFFLSELDRTAVPPGARVAIGCDGCAAGLVATVTSIASEAEFAPPVIYSTESRAKLVYRAEARPEGDALSLDPGQPVDVTLPARG